MRNIVTTKQFSLRFDRNNTISKVAARYISAQNNPIRPKIRWLTDKRDRNTLWWRVSPVELTNYTRVVRSWHARRAHAAFEEELKARGFDAKGRKLASDTQGSAVFEKIGGYLKGTAILQIRPACVQGNYPSMQREMKTVVDALMKQQLYIQQNPHAVDAGVAVLLTQDNRLIEFPSVLLPNNITSGSIVDITVSRNNAAEAANTAAFQSLQKRILNTYGIKTPSPPVLRLRNATQTSLVLEWDPIDLATASIKSLSLYRNGSKAGSIPNPLEKSCTKISGLAIHTEYTFHLVLRTTAGTYQSEKLTCRTHKMTDLSGITITTGVLHPQRKEALAAALDRIGGKLIDSVRIDTTHFVCSEGRGPLWERAQELNIPVVVPEWVDACEAEGTIVSVRGYYLNADPKARQLGPISGSTQHQRTTSSITSPSRPSQSQSLSLPPTQERDQNTPEPPTTPFPGASMSGQPMAEDDDRVSSEDESSPPPPPPKDAESEAGESPATPPKDQPETNGNPKLEVTAAQSDEDEEDEEEEEAKAESPHKPTEELEDDASSNTEVSDKGKAKENLDSDFNEVPL
ncbi:hypothetical protein BJX63DRAFT_418582 [Aspergillus granulosus]|uniref:Chitin biosynthesis protein n=1 Tax=Aspergillus granulosus TaxID=176169 RepID=A0ABR4HZD5_9EURO